MPCESGSTPRSSLLIQPDAVRRDQCGEGPEQTGFARGSRRQAHPGRAADERHHQGAETAHVRSGIRAHPAARQSRWLRRTPPGRGPCGTGAGKLHHRRPATTASPRRAWASSWLRTPTLWNTSNAVAAFIEDMRPYFPHGVEVVSPYDTVPFIKISIHRGGQDPRLEAMRAGVSRSSTCSSRTSGPQSSRSLAVPVVLLGTFGVHGGVRLFSINTLTMFGYGAGNRPACGRCHRRGRKRGPRHGTRTGCLRARGHHRRSMGQITGALASAWRRCCPPCSCRWPSSAAPSAPSTASSR